MACHAPIAICSAYGARGQVGIQVSVPVEVATVVGNEVLIITVGPVVVLMLLVVFIHSCDILLVWLYSDLLNWWRSVPLKDCCID